MWNVAFPFQLRDGPIITNVWQFTFVLPLSTEAAQIIFKNEFETYLCITWVLE